MVSGAQDDLAAILLIAVKHAVAVGGLFQAHAVADDDVRVQITLDDMFQQARQQGMDVGLPHLQGQPLVEGIAEQETMDEPGVHPRHADRSAPAPSNRAQAADINPTGPAPKMARLLPGLTPAFTAAW